MLSIFEIFSKLMLDSEITDFFKDLRKLKKYPKEYMSKHFQFKQNKLIGQIYNKYLQKKTELTISIYLVYIVYVLYFFLHILDFKINISIIDYTLSTVNIAKNSASCKSNFAHCATLVRDNFSLRCPLVYLLPQRSLSPVAS